MTYGGGGVLYPRVKPLNGCMCQDAMCEACNRVVEAFEAMREALQAVMRGVESSAGKRGTYDGEHKIDGYAQGQSRSALALADKVSRP